MHKMIKGCKKGIIYLKTTESNIFDEAYFIIRHENECKGITESEMVEEAKRIIQGAVVDDDGKITHKRRNAFPFALGAIAATALYLVLGGILNLL